MNKQWWAEGAMILALATSGTVGALLDGSPIATLLASVGAGVILIIVSVMAAAWWMQHRP